MNWARFWAYKNELHPWRLHHGAGIEVNVVDAVVDTPQLCDGLVAHRVPQFREIGCPPNLAMVAVVVVAPEAVVPAALDVERDQVHSVQSCVEEVVLYLHIFGKM